MSTWQLNWFLMPIQCERFAREMLECFGDFDFAVAAPEEVLDVVAVRKSAEALRADEARVVVFVYREWDFFDTRRKEFDVGG
jgi:hypothetical protein